MSKDFIKPWTIPIEFQGKPQHLIVPDENPAMGEQAQDDIRQQLNKYLTQLERHIEEEHPDPDMTRPCSYASDTADQILALISQTVSSVIGEPEEYALPLPEKFDELDTRRKFRNELKVEQRATAQRLLGREV